MKLNLTFAIFIWILPSYLHAQENTITLNGFVDVYLGYDFGRPSSGNRASFLYNHTRHNEVNINLAFLKGSYQNSKVRANLAIATGTYMQYNYAAEPSILQNIFEANVGVRLGEETWIDAGVLPSHIGFESAISKDCWTLSRSIAAENSPYFETGIKLSHNLTNKISLNLLYLNGWQRIKKLNNNTTPSFGTQLLYKWNDDGLINWSTYVGNDNPDSTRKMRYFNNLYSTFKLSEKTYLTVGCDFGIEQKYKKSTRYSKWFTPQFVIRRKLTQNLTMATRVEYFADYGNVIIAAPNQDIRLMGFSINADYEVFKNTFARFEVRRFGANQAVFQNGQYSSNSNMSLLSSLSVSF
ncbi:MAG: porin [Spirosomaceae bacterium]|jgi:hypothetical protein|nr:porin [Spirosomataceae bacterium]